MKIYFANGLFSAGDIMFNNYCWDKLVEAGIKEEDIYMPQKNEAINDKTASATSLPIYEGDTERLKEADIIIAVLDGVSIDAGVASEVGWVAGWNEFRRALIQYAPEDKEYIPYGKKTILGLYTDCRDFSKTHNEDKDWDSEEAGLGESQYDYKNLYTVGCCKRYGKIFDSIEKLVEYLKTLEK